MYIYRTCKGVNIRGGNLGVHHHLIFFFLKNFLQSSRWLLEHFRRVVFLYMCVCCCGGGVYYNNVLTFFFAHFFGRGVGKKAESVGPAAAAGSFVMGRRNRMKGGVIVQDPHLESD